MTHEAADTDVKPSDEHGIAAVPDLLAIELNKISQRYLGAMAVVLSVFYSLRGTAFLIDPKGGDPVVLAVPAFLTAFYGIWISRKAQAQQLGRKAVEVNFFVICLALIGNTALAYIEGFNAEITPNMAFVLVAAGLGTISVWNWLAQVAFVVAGYGTVLATIGPPDDKPFLFYLLTGGALSFLAFKARLSVIRDRMDLEVELIDKAQKLEAANKAKDRFMANVTHDLRTPMTGVLGMMDLLRDTKLTKEQARLLETAKTSAGYLLAIINDILDYSKLESGKFELKPAPMDAVAITQDVVEMLRSQAQAKDIALTLNLPDEDLIVVNGDGVRIGQVLFNLVGNAIKFTEKGGVTVTMQLHTHQDRLSIEWIVSDTGAGIPQGRITKLFDRFEQLDASSTRQQQQGTGLGLAIIKELLALMGGHVEVASVVGEGTEFSFTVPLERLSADQLKAAPAVAVPEAVLSLPLRILVAEDNKVNQALIERLLVKQGWTVQMVENGETAVAAATKTDKPYDLILMDVQMPVMNGLTATRIIKEKMVSPPPVIALTANTMKEDVARYLEAGMDAHVGKPINMEELRSAIAKILMARHNPPE
ncbi:hybrid sensor histidine kinase/response regulator [Kordiimonas lacus]|uniref:histidine kinase n=1 Tax=Kordiimonas lacus TaxID=637679 RepID=A0A1G6ZR09_9PROT|nr:ATP-binding protein [Kordiimonas lacus]SDE04285.1 Signal transduction histidine kinase [Kordiimonas lacus]